MINAIREQLSKIAFLDKDEIVTLHFSLLEEIKKQRADNNQENVILLCERSIAISSIVMQAMKKRHIEGMDEYSRSTGTLSNNKFYYPNHYALPILGGIYKKNGELSKLNEMNDKLLKEGWNTGKEEELYFL